ncbi:LOW QUALITY PROTEIN: protein mono-ADP-ribosyltransferase PARP10 [Pterocles gutturalis]
MAGGVLAVGGVPPEVSEELVVLYFESRRRSGGGPILSCQRLGSLFFLTFQSPQDAANALARPLHRLEGAMLEVHRAPPWDPTRLLVGGLDPRTPPEQLRPCLETLLGRPPSAVGVCRGPAPGWVLLRLRDPLTPQELAAAEQRARRWGPGGPALALLRLPQTRSVLVRAAAPVLSRDLLELYFENQRSGGGRVQRVRVRPGAREAIVTFEEPEATERVLRRPHRLQDAALSLAPYYSFLEPLDGDAVLPPDMALDTAPEMAPAPDMALTLVTAPTLPQDTAPTPDTAQAPPPDPAPASPDPCPVPGEPPAASPSGDGDKDTANWQWQEMAVTAVQDEVVVPAEPGAVRFLQRHYQELLGSIPDVSLLPLEGGDVAGFRVSGETGRCRAAAEFLQSLLGSVGATPATLQLPGVARFLRDAGGQSVLRDLETRCHCVIDLDGPHWTPPDTPLELAELLPPSCHHDPLPAALRRDLPDDANGAGDADSADGDRLHSNIEEIKELLAALRPGEGNGDPALQPGDVPTGEWDPEWDGTGDVPAAVVEEEEEEAARLALAIQRSMESTRREDEELARATALSLRSFHRQQQQEEEEEDGEEDAGLLAALEASLEEALPAANMVRVTVFCALERGAAAAVPRELERVLAGRLQDAEVTSERLRVLPAACHRILALLQRRHAVRLHLHAGTATLRGFAEYTTAAARDLELLLQRLPEPPSTAGTAAVRWVRWDPSGTAVPYIPAAAALLEGAWQRRERRLALLLDGQPVTVDLERMEEYNIGNARAAPVSRSRLPLESARWLLGLESPGLEEEEEEVRLMPLAKDSEEFGDATRHFYETLEELRGHITVVKVEKLVHPLLYRQYQLKKGSMQRGRAGSTAEDVERILFHGTTEASSREICLHGFNRSFCGRNAALYGLGVYFAAWAGVSAQDRFSPPSPNGNKFVFVATVLTGAFAMGGPGLRAPPLREEAGGGPPRRYDSVVDDPRRPSIFVIFNDTQAYPRYLLTCRRQHPPGTPRPSGPP